MPFSFEIPSHNALLAEQAAVQAEKFQGRLLAEYSSCMFPGQRWLEPRGSAVVDFVRQIIGDTERANLGVVLDGLSEVKDGKLLRWVDMGGGRALPMRQLGVDPDRRQKLHMTNVDLFNFGLVGLKFDEVDYLESLAPGMTNPKTEPMLITDNIETVSLPEPADIITSVETIQYLYNPLGAIANWYNQLTDNGIMIVATNRDWPSWIRYCREPASSMQDETPAKHLLETFSQAGVNHAATDKSDSKSGVRPDFDPDYFRILAIQKKPGTSLRVTKHAAEVWINPDKFKAVYYEAPTNDSSPTVEVIKSSTHKALGANALEAIS